MGKVVVVMCIADAVGFPFLRLYLDGEHAGQGWEGGIKVCGRARAEDAWTRGWEAAWTTLLVQRLMERLELKHCVT